MADSLFIKNGNNKKNLIKQQNHNNLIIKTSSVPFNTNNTKLINHNLIKNNNINNICSLINLKKNLRNASSDVDLLANKKCLNKSGKKEKKCGVANNNNINSGNNIVTKISSDSEKNYLIKNSDLNNDNNTTNLNNLICATQSPSSSSSTTTSITELTLLQKTSLSSSSSSTVTTTTTSSSLISPPLFLQGQNIIQNINIKMENNVVGLKKTLVNNKINNQIVLNNNSNKNSNTSSASSNSSGNLSVGLNKTTKKELMVASSTSSSPLSSSSQEADDCRKKRCSDRYDSSESSDSGVATLSCTDSSTASSDSSDSPGSPYSPSSSCEDSSSQTNNKSVTTTTTISPPPPPKLVPSATSTPKSSSLTTTTAGQLTTTPPTTAIIAPSSLINHRNKSTTNITNVTNGGQTHSKQQQHNWPWSNTTTVSSVNKLKRLSAGGTPTNGDVVTITKRIRTASVEKKNSIKQQLQQQQKEEEDKMISPQTKITGFFKSQMKPLNGLKKDISNLVSSITPTTTNLASNNPSMVVTSTPKTGLQKYFNILAAKSLEAAAALNGKTAHCPTTSTTVTVAPTLISTTTMVGTNTPTTTTAGKKAIERKTAKVAPNQRKNLANTNVSSGPKKPVSIAPRMKATPKVITAPPQMQPSQLPPPQQQQQPQQQMSGQQQTQLIQQTSMTPQQAQALQQQVVMAAFRLQAGLDPNSHATQHMAAMANNAAAVQQLNKMGTIYQLAMPNLVQIQNKLYAPSRATTAMTNQQMQAAAQQQMNANVSVNAAGQFFMNGTVIKLQPITNGTDGTASFKAINHPNQQQQQQTTQSQQTIVPFSQTQSPTMQSTLMATGTTAPGTPNKFNYHPHQVFMTTTTPGLILNTATLPQLGYHHHNQQPQTQQTNNAIPALHPISHNVLPSISTILPNHQHHQQQHHIPQLNNNFSGATTLPSLSPTKIPIATYSSASNNGHLHQMTQQAQTPPQLIHQHQNVSSVQQQPSMQQQQQPQYTVSSFMPALTLTTTTTTASGIPQNVQGTIPTTSIVEPQLPKSLPMPPPLVIAAPTPASTVTVNSTAPHKLKAAQLSHHVQQPLSIELPKLVPVSSTTMAHSPIETSIILPPTSLPNAISVSTEKNTQLAALAVNVNVAAALVTPVVKIEVATIPTPTKTSPCVVDNLGSPKLKAQISPKIRTALSVTTSLTTITSSNITTSSVVQQQPPACLPSPKSLLLEKIQQKTILPSLRSPTLSPLSPHLLKSPTIETEFNQAVVALPESAKSPILSQPKTIRFPPPKNCEVVRIGTKIIRKSADGKVVGMCYWENCNEKYDTNSKLLDHMQQQHVNLQTGPFACLWAGCKVYGKESCSKQWLERHVPTIHGGTKPFKCIFGGCGLRFGSHLALQKHVNSHFNSEESTTNSSKKSSDPPMPKQLRKNGKKLRYRRQPWSARMFDFFDSGVMEGLQHRLQITGTITNGPNGLMNFKGKIIGRRTSPAGIAEVYVKWNPCDIIPTEWIPETPEIIQQKCAEKSVSIYSLTNIERHSLLRFLKRVNKLCVMNDNNLSLLEALSKSVTATGTSSSLSSSSLSSSLTSISSAFSSIADDYTMASSTSSSSSSSIKSSLNNNNSSQSSSSSSSASSASSTSSGRRRHRKPPKMPS